MTVIKNFIDHRIAGRVSNQFRRVVRGKTDIVAMNSGRERRNAAWQFKKMQFTANFAMLTREAQQEVVNAFYACQAQLYLFRFRDYGDYQADHSPLLTAAVVGTTDPIQITKRYQFGPVYADRMIQALGPSCTVYDSGNHAVTGTFDLSLGIFTPTSAWGSGEYTWSGTFDCWVRFNSDDLDITMQNIEISTADVELAEQLAYSSGS